MEADKGGHWAAQYKIDTTAGQHGAALQIIKEGQSIEEQDIIGIHSGS